jgi:hypothetical protein
MKTYALLLGLCTLTFCITFGKIKNGYQSEIANCQKALDELRAMLESDDLTSTQRKKIKSRITAIEDHIVFYHLTEELIRQLKMVSPDIYEEMNVLTDKRSRETDIYVKVVKQDESPTREFDGAAFFSQSGGDEDRCTSKYGEGTVSIRVSAATNTLAILCHEFGHLKYIVPNLAEYIRFHKKRYSHMFDAWLTGHDAYDKSGATAYQFESRNRKDQAVFLKNGGTRFEPLVSLLQRFRKYPNLAALPALPVETAYQFEELVLPDALHLIPH